MKYASRFLAFGIGLFAAASSFGQAVPQPGAAFVEIPRVKEFRGVLVARPLQVEAAKARGMQEREARSRAAAALRALADFEIQNYFGEVDEFLIKVPGGQHENLVAGRLMASGDFEYVEPDWRVFPIGCPNDATFSQQWHHAANRLGSCAAWDLETGSPEITIAICDTGVRTTHQDLQLHRREAYNVVGGVARRESQGAAIADINGHGTACTGSAAANGNNALGVAGIGWNLGHRSLRVTDSSDGGAYLSDLTFAARTAADLGDRVVSVSYSGVNSSSVFSTGTYVRGKGSMLVWAAGNSNVDLVGNRNDNVLVVGASDQNDAKASFSNYGSLVDFYAPGVSIRTTSNGGDTAYSSVSGTSFACPITAGLCGLIWSRNPTLTPAEVEDILRSTCKDLGAAGVDNVFGYGRIDAYAAILATPAPSGGDVTPPANPAGLVATAGNARVTLGWDANGEDDLSGYRLYRSTTSGGGYAEIGGGLLSGTSFVDTAVANGTTYFYVVRAEDTSGNLSGNSNQISARPVAPQPVVLFADNFESGGLAAGGWSVANGNSSAVGAAAQTGSFGARIIQTGWIQRNVNTAGFGTIELRFGRRTAGMDANQSEVLTVEWWNGNGWVAAEATRETKWKARVFALPAAAGNNANFAIRFRTNCNLANESADVDNIELRGTPLD